MARYESDVQLIRELHYPPFSERFQLNIGLRGVSDYGPSIRLIRDDGEDRTTVRVICRRGPRETATYTARTGLKVKDARARILRHLDGAMTVDPLANAADIALANIPVAIQALAPDYAFAGEPTREWFCQRCAAAWDGPEGRTAQWCPFCAGDRIRRTGERSDSVRGGRGD